jgi:hypothetical protein
VALPFFLGGQVAGKPALKKKKKEGCGLEGCTTNGHYKTSHCSEWPQCKALRNVDHNPDCPNFEATGIEKYMAAPGAGSNWWSLTWVVVGESCPEAWLLMIFNTLVYSLHATKVKWIAVFLSSDNTVAEIYFSNA